MAAHGNPNIVTDGLVLCLDAANKNSYPGSGTTWTDLSGNGNTADISNYDNTPTFDSTTNSFDFNSDKRFYIDISELNNANSYSVIWWGIGGSGNEYGGISRHDDWDTGNHLVAWQTGAINSDSGRDTNSNSDGDNFMICHTNDTSTKAVEQYLNGSWYGQFTYSSWNARERWSIGCRGDGNGHQYTGKIAVIALYNRLLSSKEVSQNFNAQRSRFSV